MLQSAIQSFVKNGYGIIPNFLSSELCDRLTQEIDRIIDEYNPRPDEIVMFSTKHDQYKKHDYYLGSVDQVRCFLEEGTYRDGEFIDSKRRAVSKIGHALHQKNQLFKSITYKTLIKDICKECKIQDPIVVQSMAILKPQKNQAKVISHQDSTFLYDEPISLLGFWTPFVDTTLDNGCLWGVPGSHQGRLYLRASMNWQKKQSNLKKLHEEQYKQSDFVPIQMKKGSLAFFSGLWVHKSNENLSMSSRYAYTWHVKQKNNLWASDNWLQRKFPQFQYNYQ